MGDTLFKIEGVEVFATGVWNGNKITDQDLDDMVSAYDSNKEGVKPFLKLGHNSDQALLKSGGLPAAGWVENLRKVGDKLVADFVDIPKQIYKLLQNKAFRKVSSEVYYDIEIKGKKFRRMLGAVALLGAETPGVMNLKDILAQYGLEYIKYDNECESHIYNFNEMEANIMPDKTAKEAILERDLADAKKALENAQKENKKFSADIKDAEKNVKTISELQSEVKKYKADAALEAEKARKAEVDKSVSDLEKEGLCTPAMKEYVLNLLEPQKEEYTINEKKMSKYDILKETLKLQKASFVNLEEDSDVGDTEAKTLESKINKYCLDNPEAIYGDVYEMFMKEDK